MHAYIKDYLNSLDTDVEHAVRDLNLVTRLQALHLTNYSFSSVNALQDLPLSTEPEQLFKRLITDKQGGYCFEHNKIFYLALQALGFNVQIVIARVMLNGQLENPRSHRLTLLTLDGKQYLVDVGFGVSTPILPLAIDQSGIVAEGMNKYRITRCDNIIMVHQQQPEEKYLYRVELAEFFESDCDIAHFYSHQHPSAAFVNNLVVSRIADGERFLIRNQSFFYWHQAKSLHTEQVIESSEHLYQLIREVFLLNVSLQSAQWLFTKMRSAS